MLVTLTNGENYRLIRNKMGGLSTMYLHINCKQIGCRKLEVKTIYRSRNISKAKTISISLLTTEILPPYFKKENEFLYVYCYIILLLHSITFIHIFLYFFFPSSLSFSFFLSFMFWLLLKMLLMRLTA